MDFINYVAAEMFTHRAVPSNPKNVQIYMEHMLNRLRVINKDDSQRTTETYSLELQGRIELDRHYALYGKFKD